MNNWRRKMNNLFSYNRVFTGNLETLKIATKNVDIIHQQIQNLKNHFTIEDFNCFKKITLRIASFSPQLSANISSRLEKKLTEIFPKDLFFFPFLFSQEATQKSENLDKPPFKHIDISVIFQKNQPLRHFVLLMILSIEIGMRVYTKRSQLTSQNLLPKYDSSVNLAIAIIIIFKMDYFNLLSHVFIEQQDGNEIPVFRQIETEPNKLFFVVDEYVSQIMIAICEGFLLMNILNQSNV